jgi:hypothetical protein
MLFYFHISLPIRSRYFDDLDLIKKQNKTYKDMRKSLSDGECWITSLLLSVVVEQPLNPLIRSQGPKMQLSFDSWVFKVILHMLLGL